VFDQDKRDTRGLSSCWDAAAPDGALLDGSTRDGATARHDTGAGRSEGYP